MPTLIYIRIGHFFVFAKLFNILVSGPNSHQITDYRSLMPPISDGKSFYQYPPLNTDTPTSIPSMNHTSNASIGYSFNASSISTTNSSENQSTNISSKLSTDVNIIDKRQNIKLSDQPKTNTQSSGIGVNDNNIVISNNIINTNGSGHHSGSNSVNNSSSINNNNNNNINTSNKNNNLNVSKSIKSEHFIKTEKSGCRSPSASMMHKVDYFVNSDRISTSDTSSLNKSLCDTPISTFSSPSNNTQVSLSSANISSLGIQQSQIGNYINPDANHQSLSQHLQQRNAFDTTEIMSNHMTMDEQYIREQQMRYSQHLSEINGVTRPTVSYPSDIVSSRVGYDIVSRPYDPGSIPTSVAFDRYDVNSLAQRSNMYPYLQPTMEDLNNQQKYLQEQQQMAHAMLKAEHEENCGPIYPRPVYHYDPASGPLPAGFSAINLSVKVSAAQAAAFKGSASSPGVPVIDLSTSSVTSSSPSNFSGPHYVNRKIGSSPQPGCSPHLASPQVPSPQGQTLDLSVSRLSHKYRMTLVAKNQSKEIISSGPTSPTYLNHANGMQHGAGFSGPRSPQTEPVDFSAPPRPMHFGLVGPIGHTPYSRESTPDSGTSHYVDSYRDPSGKYNRF